MPHLPQKESELGVCSTLPRHVVQGRDPVDNAENFDWNYTINPNRNTDGSYRGSRTTIGIFRPFALRW